MRQHTTSMAAILTLAGAAAGQQFRVIASPGGEGLPGSKAFGDSQVCRDGGVAFSVQLGPDAPGGEGHGIAVWLGEQPTLIARTGGPAIGLGDRFSAPRLAGQGTVCFLSERAAPSSIGPSLAKQQALWMWRHGRLAPVVFTGQAASAVSVGAVHDQILDGFAVNELGQVAFCSRVIGRGLPKKGIACLWLWSEGSAKLLAREAVDVVAGAGLQVFALNGAAAVNASGQVLAHAWVTTGPGKPLACVFATGENGRMEVLAMEGMTVDVGVDSARVLDALPIGLSDAGEALLLVSTSTPAKHAGSRVPMLASGGVLRPLADERSVLPGVPSMGQDGQIALAMAPTDRTQGATFFVGPFGAMRPHMSCPELPPAEWLCAAPPNRLGETLVRGVGASDGSEGPSVGGLWALLPGGSPRLLVRDDAAVDLFGAGERIAKSFSPRGIDEAGMAVFEVSFADGASAILQLNARSVCGTDFDHNGVVDREDLQAFLDAYLTRAPERGADTNGDGRVDGEDLQQFVTAYFEGCD